MKQATKQKLPPGWTEKKIRAVIAHYDNQTEEEAAAEIAAAPAVSETWMSVPTELVDAVTRLIEKYENGRGRTSNHSKKRSKR